MNLDSSNVLCTASGAAAAQMATPPQLLAAQAPQQRAWVHWALRPPISRPRAWFAKPRPVRCWPNCLRAGRPAQELAAAPGLQGQPCTLTEARETSGCSLTMEALAIGHHMERPYSHIVDKQRGDTHAHTQRYKRAHRHTHIHTPHPTPHTQNHEYFISPRCKVSLGNLRFLFFFKMDCANSAAVLKPSPWSPASLRWRRPWSFPHFRGAPSALLQRPNHGCKRRWSTERPRAQCLYTNKREYTHPKDTEAYRWAAAATGDGWRSRLLAPRVPWLTGDTHPPRSNT